MEVGDEEERCSNIGSAASSTSSYCLTPNRSKRFEELNETVQIELNQCLQLVIVAE
jgi:hypothetical protein